MILFPIIVGKIDCADRNDLFPSIASVLIGSLAFHFFPTKTNKIRKMLRENLVKEWTHLRRLGGNSFVALQVVSCYNNVPLLPPDDGKYN